MLSKFIDTSTPLSCHEAFTGTFELSWTLEEAIAEARSDTCMTLLRHSWYLYWKTLAMF